MTYRPHALAAGRVVMEIVHMSNSYIWLSCTLYYKPLVSSYYHNYEPLVSRYYHSGSQVTLKKYSTLKSSGSEVAMEI